VKGLFSRILIANRGEIAVRVIRACRELGISPVAVYSEADRQALHVRLADEAYLLGPALARESYLNIGRIIEVARRCGAEAIHPGYGFLSENPEFAEACVRAGLVFIGPPPEALRAAGEKTAAKELARKVGVPLVPGSEGPVSDQEAAELARKVGYPVVVKAAAGGGGKGMRIVRSAEELPSALQLARSEALAAFGDDSVYIEKYIDPARHIEIQVLCDGYGNCIHLGERECSIQRRYQKLIEESPSPVMDPDLRAQMGEAALAIVRAAGYVNAGTCEFLVGPDRKFYFLEVNARIQVEHPVTEMVTGVDLVAEQIKVAAGRRLSLSQKDVVQRGWAIECRVYAEDPDNNFLPSAGRILALREPSGPGIRVDSGLYPGQRVTIDYDPMLSKVIAWGRDRKEAIARMLQALAEYDVVGLKTTIPFHRAVLADPRFQAGEFDTNYVAKHWPGVILPEDLLLKAAVAAAVEYHTRPKVGSKPAVSPRAAESPWKLAGRWAALRGG